MRKRSLIILMLFSIMLTLVGCDFFKDPENNYEGCTNIEMAVIWNGLSTVYPSTKTDNPTAKVIRDKTNINMNFTFYQGAENDNLTRLFAVGKNMPDVIMAPYWGGGDACSQTIRQAVKDGLLIPVDEYLEEYGENIKDSWDIGISEGFKRLELNNEVFDGKKYIIPMQTPASPEDFENWGYSVFCRKDILNSLGVDPSTINSSDDLYELSKSIKNASFKDINGNDIIICTTHAYGYSYECYLNSFKRRNAQTNVIIKDNGDYDWICNNDLIEEEIKFMNKMINEGLFDKTCFAQTNDSVIQKMVTGSAAMIACRYEQLTNMLQQTLYVNHPEMEYVAIGPIYDANGVAAMPDSYREESGEYGFPVLLITKDCKDPVSVIKYLNYINSDEGEIICKLGVEGEDFIRTGDHQFERTEVWKENLKQNPAYAIERGTKYLYIGISQCHNSWFDGLMYITEEEKTAKKALEEMYPIHYLKGTFASSFDSEYEDIEYFRNILNAMNYATTIESAYCSSNEESALKILQKYRNNLAKGDYLANYLAWLKQRLANEKDIIY